VSVQVTSDERNTNGEKCKLINPDRRNHPFSPSFHEVKFFFHPENTAVTSEANIRTHYAQEISTQGGRLSVQTAYDTKRCYA
jgi:hypothetical protein